VNRTRAEGGKRGREEGREKKGKKEPEQGEREGARIQEDKAKRGASGSQRPIPAMT